MDIRIKDALTILPDFSAGEHSVYIRNGLIAGIDREPLGFFAARTIDGRGKLLTPGLINAHTHVYMTALRNRADDLNFMTWLFDNVIPLENRLTPEDAYYSTQLGCMEMLKSGVTGLLDMHMFPSAVPKAFADAGIRAVVSRGLQGETYDDPAGNERLSQAIGEMEEFSGTETLSFMLAPHAPYTCGEGFLCHVGELAREKGVGINTHLSESLDEQNRIKSEYGVSPAEYYDRCGILGENTVCAHCVYLSESDMELLAQKKVSVAHNPASNMKLGNGFAPVPHMLKKGINVALGTDGCCSNNNQSVLKEMELCSLIHKGVSCEATTVSAKQVFRMATEGGARALGFGDKAGAIKVGAFADLALFDLDFPGFFPLGDPIAALCYSGAGLNAETVLVNGKILLEKGKFLTIDEERIKHEIRNLTARLDV